MQTVTATVSRAGGRSRNEDDLRWRDGDAMSYWLLADGLGGHAAGDVAARLAVTAAEQMLLDAIKVVDSGSESTRPSITGDQPAGDAELLARLRRAFAGAQHALLQGMADAPGRAGMRATLVAALRIGERLAWGHVGDSRLYHFSERRLRAMTRDHSVRAMIEMPPRDVRADAARNHLLRVLGEADTDTGAAAGAGAPELAAPIAARPGDALLLCSDGWWDHVLETEMELDLAAARSPAEWLQRMEDRLLERASGDYDNYTAIAVWCVDQNAARVDL